MTRMNESTISKRQLTRMIYIEGFGAGGLTFPAVAALNSRSEGLLPIMVYGVFLSLFIGWMLYLIKKLEKTNPVGMRSGYGFVLGKTIGAIYIFRLFLNGLALFYFFGLSIQKIYMPDAGLLKILLPFSFLLWYCTQTTLQKRARFLELLFPWIVALFCGLILFSVLGMEGDIRWFSFKDDVSVLWKNGFALLLFTTPLEFLFFLVPAVAGNFQGNGAAPKNNQEKAAPGDWDKRRKWVWKAAGGVFLWNVLLWFVTVETLGGKLTASSPWPVIKVMQLIHLPGGFLERFDILLVVFWILCLVGVLSGYLYYGRKIGEEVFGGGVSDGKTLRRRVAAITAGVVAIMLIVSCFLIDGKEKQWMEWFIFYKQWIDFPLLILLPLFASVSHPRRKMASLAAIVIFILTLSGCQKQSDVEEKSYVLSLYAEDNGEKGYTYWVSKANLAAMENKEDSIPCITIHFEAQSLKEMEEKYEKTEVGILEWNHIETIFLGPKLAGNAEKTDAFLEEWEVSWQKSPNVLLTVCQQSAEELADIKDIPEGAAGQEVSRLMEQAEQNKVKGWGNSNSYCRTPIEVLRAKNEGRKDIYLYQTKVQWKRLVLKEGYRLPENV